MSRSSGCWTPCWWRGGGTAVLSRKNTCRTFRSRRTCAGARADELGERGEQPRCECASSGRTGATRLRTDGRGGGRRGQRVCEIGYGRKIFAGSMPSARDDTATRATEPGSVRRRRLGSMNSPLPPLVTTEAARTTCARGTGRGRCQPRLFQFFRGPGLIGKRTRGRARRDGRAWRRAYRTITSCYSLPITQALLRCPDTVINPSDERTRKGTTARQTKWMA